jgi:16S rRNA (cytosine967-C5)-methyltransferase
MTPSARLSAAIEVLDAILARHRPAADALADWGRAHRFAGSGDRAAIGNLVFDALRKKSSLAWRMGSDTPRAVLLGLIGFEWESPAALDRLASGERFAPAPLTDDERAALARTNAFAGAPAHVRGDYPDWLDSGLARVFGEARAAEGAAMAERAPIDLRVNTLKSDRAKALAALEPFHAAPTPIAPTGIRIAPGKGAQRSPNIEVEAAYQKGFVELQDEGSQLAALLAGAEPGEQVADLCAGGGGKTLALAAAMENRGQLYAWDDDRHRLAPIYQRLERAGVRNAQVKRGGDEKELAPLDGKMDRVVLDVPCSGTGAWRRRPDAKWRIREKAVPERMAEQDAILARGARLVRPGGRLVYITCSLLAEENEDRVAAFLGSEAGRGFVAVDPAPEWRRLVGGTPPAPPQGVAGLVPSVRLSPRATQTDGFFVCVMERGR